MTFHPLHMVLLVLVTTISWRLVGALRSGRVWATRKVSHIRDDQPVEYWFTVLFEAGLLPVLLWFAYDLSREVSIRSAGSVLLLLFVISTLFWLLRAVKVGTTGLGTIAVERRNQPFAFWSILVFQLAIAGGLVWFASGFRPSGFRAVKRHEADKIYAVTAVVREQIPKGTNAVFENVRADAGSGFVCGDLALKDGRQRFFGEVAAEEVRVILEHQKHPGFSMRYARVCGGKWVLPPVR